MPNLLIALTIIYVIIKQRRNRLEDNSNLLLFYRTKTVIKKIQNFKKGGIMNYYNSIKQELINNEINRGVKTYSIYTFSKSHSVSDKLTYTHYKLLFSIKNNNAIEYYIDIAKQQNLSVRQLQVYMNYIDKNIKEINQSKTIGIIMCTENNGLIIKYSSDPRIIARTYKII